ncbi:MAG: phage/plasmid primase, P4 family [Gammaproteobacteria bacterium]
MQETGAGSRMLGEVVKKLLDSGEIVARYPHGRVFSYEPTFTPLISTNHKPRVDDLGEGLWRRLVLVPFEYTIPTEKRNARFIDEVLKPESSGILNWCLQGAVEYQENGLDIPVKVKVATEEYKDESDLVQQFIDEEMVAVFDKPAKELLTKVHSRYVAWCKSKNRYPYSDMVFANKLRERGVEVRKSTDNKSTMFGYQLNSNMIDLPQTKF